MRDYSPLHARFQVYRPRAAYTSRLLVWCGVSLLALAAGCGVIKEKPKTEESELAALSKPMPPEKAKEVLQEVGGNFAYGPGLGGAALNLGTSIVFPPYLIYLLGNTALSLSGYEPVTVSSLLPEEEGRAWSNGYDTVVSGPGKVVAAVSGHEYRSQEVAQERLRMVIDRPDPKQDRAQMKDTKR